MWQSTYECNNGIISNEIKLIGLDIIGQFFLASDSDIMLTLLIKEEMIPLFSLIYVLKYN